MKSSRRHLTLAKNANSNVIAPILGNNHETVALSRMLGWFSLGLGVLEFVRPRRVNRTAGLARALPLLRLFGLREIATGYAVLKRPESASPLWARLVGDVLDVAIVAKGLTRQNPQRLRTAISCAGLLVIATVDFLCALNVESRKNR